MKTLFINGWKTLKIENEHSTNEDLIQGVKIKEGGVLNVEISSINSSCLVSILDSAYLSSGPTKPLRFGEASSAVDRAIEFAIASLKSNERVLLDITIGGEFVHESCCPSPAHVTCYLNYRVIQNAKEIYDYTDLEKLEQGRRYKGLALSKLLQANPSYKYPVHLSVFLLLVRSIKWLAAITPDSFSDPEKDSFNLLKIQCYNNLCYYHLTFGNYEKAVVAASIVLNQDASNVKGLYRRAVANSYLQNYELAESDLRLLLTSEPSNMAAKKQLESVNEQKRKLDSKYAQAMKKFLNFR